MFLENFKTNCKHFLIEASEGEEESNLWNLWLYLPQSLMGRAKYAEMQSIFQSYLLYSHSFLGKKLNAWL